MLVSVSAKPMIHVGTQPSDGPAMELPLLRESADKREGGENPTMAPREPRYVMRCEDLIPNRKSFVHPARQKHVGWRHSRVAQRSPKKLVGIHGATCPRSVVPVA
jgi:hypothetical protein